MKYLREFQRPLRIPEDIELGNVKPDVAKAGEKSSWTLEFILAKKVPQNKRILLYVHGGRHNKIEWGNLQTQHPSKEGYVSLRNYSGKEFHPTRISIDGGLIEFKVPAGGLKKGEQITAELGGKAGAFAPKFSSPNKFFLLLEASPIQTTQKFKAPRLSGEALRRVVGACLIHVIGSDAKFLRAFAKSKAVVGEELSLLVRGDDEYGNVSSEELGHLSVHLDGQEVNVQRVPLEASTCCILRGMFLKNPGVYRFQVVDISKGLTALTNPIKCYSSPASSGVLWGVIHGHTEISDGVGSLDHYFSYMRDACFLDFGATGDHDHCYETSEDMWRLTQDTVVKNNEPKKFTTFLGYEWAKWRKNGDGDRNVYYRYDRRPRFRSDNGHYPTPKDLFEALKNETALIIPHHTAFVGNHCDWKDHETEKERLVEIYSVWGSSERSVNQGNLFRIKHKKKEKESHLDNPAGFVQKALELGWRVGFTAGGDDHIGHVGDNINWWGYKAGLMAVHAEENTRESIWNAMLNRRGYGTTGARIIVDFQIDRHAMGSELLLSEHPELAHRRKLSASIHGTDKIESIQIVRNNKDVYNCRADSCDVTLDWNDMDPLVDVNLPPAPYCPLPFTFYYLRVQQTDREMAWASPIWILSNQTCDPSTSTS